MAQSTKSLKFQLILGIALFGVVCFLYDSVLLDMAMQWWDDPDYSHGMLVPLVSLYYAWEKRGELSKLPLAPDYRGLLLLVGGLGLLTLGNAGSEFFLMRFSFIITISGLIVVLFGLDALLSLRFPIAFLFFMIPLPAIIFNAVAFPLQLFAAQTAAFCLKAVQIPVLREGNLIYLASSTMDVTEACSGIRSLMSLMALGTLFAYVTQANTLKRSLMMLSTIPIAILANAFRVTGTGLLAQFVGEEAAQGFYHTFTGWLVFIFAFFLLLLLGFIFSRFKDKEEDVEEKGRSVFLSRNDSIWLPVLLSCIFLGIGLFVNKSLLIQESPVPLLQEFSKLPLEIDQWRGEDLPFEKKTVEVLGVTEYVNRRYLLHETGSGSQKPIWLYAGFYASQKKGQSYHSPKNCLPGSGWEIVNIEELNLPMYASLGNEQEHVVNKVLIQKGIERQLIIYWYQDRGRIITSEYWAKIYLVWDSITKGRTDGSLVRVSIPIARDERLEDALALGLEYIKSISPMLAEHLPGSQIIRKEVRKA